MKSSFFGLPARANNRNPSARARPATAGGSFATTGALGASGLSLAAAILRSITTGATAALVPLPMYLSRFFWKYRIALLRVVLRSCCYS